MGVLLKPRQSVNPDWSDIRGLDYPTCAGPAMGGIRFAAHLGASADVIRRMTSALARSSRLSKRKAVRGWGCPREPTGTAGRAGHGVQSPREYPGSGRWWRRH